MRRLLGPLLLSAVAGAACLTASAPPAPVLPARSPDPEYDAKGELKRPEGFRTWVFVGTSLGLRYHKNVPATPPREADRPKTDKPGDFHNVYIRPEAYDQYRKTGTFPDRTMLVMDVYTAKERDPKGIVSAGLFSAGHRGFEVAVKNRNRPDGSKTEWAYYDFGAGAKATAAAFPDAACHDCHRKHADVDNVWVQFYPALRDRENEARP